MKYGPVSIDIAEGSVLAHTLRPSSGRPIKKGTKLTAQDAARIAASGVDTILAAILEADDIGEDKAAAQLGSALANEQIRAENSATGRVNLYSKTNGLFDADRSLVDEFNRIDPGITLATLDRNREVNDGRMVATVKIIPYAVGKPAVDAALAVAQRQPLAVHPYLAARIGVVATKLPQLKPSVMDKTIKVLERRLAASKSHIVREIRTTHTVDGIAEAIAQLIDSCDLIVAFGASAICDIGDVIPAAIDRLGGRIEHFGMPVDPGNLLLVGDIGGTPVIGAPGCARSPAENGFDWVLQRILAGQKITAAEITGMGVGGLLMEIGMRPQPREGAVAPVSRSVAAIVLAAGQSRRMGKRNKLTARIDGDSVVGHVARAALKSGADPVIVVTGHEPEAVRNELGGLQVTYAHNVDYAAGLSTSLARGIEAVPKESGGAIVLLGDMPRITAPMIDSMLQTAEKSPPESIVVATYSGKRGNPVLWPRRYFEQLRSVSGDVGARHIIGENEQRVVLVELGEAAGFDIDTPEALAAAEAAT